MTRTQENHKLQKYWCGVSITNHESYRAQHLWKGITDSKVRHTNQKPNCNNSSTTICRSWRLNHQELISIYKNTHIFEPKKILQPKKIHRRIQLPSPIHVNDPCIDHPQEKGRMYWNWPKKGYCTLWVRPTSTKTTDVENADISGKGIVHRASA